MTGSSPQVDAAGNHNDVAIEMVQLLVSRILHDLSGPAGALANGVEMAVESDALDPAVSGLLSLSAETLLSRIRLLGIAFGRMDPAKSTSLASVGAAVRAYLADRPRLSLEFPDGDAPAGFSSLLPMLVVVAAACLPKQGKITVSTHGEGCWRVAAEGPALRLDPDLSALLAGQGEASSASAAPALIAGKLAATLGWRLSAIVAPDDSAPRLTISVGKSRLVHSET